MKKILKIFFHCGENGLFVTSKKEAHRQDMFPFCHHSMLQSIKDAIETSILDAQITEILQSILVFFSFYLTLIGKTILSPSRK